MRSTDHVPVWVRLGYAIRSTGLPWLPLPLEAPRYAVHIQAGGFLLISAANDDPNPPRYDPPPRED